MLTIINDILDMSKIEAGKITIEHIGIPPIQIVQEAALLMQPAARSKGVDVVVVYDTPIPVQIKSDPTRLRQILSNLIGNALKFTHSGTVTIHVAADVHRQRLQLSIVDTGIGMSVEQRDAIARFDAFSQADGSTTRKFGGTGLGLRISNSFAKMLGGQIEVESTLGKGSTFTVTVATGDLTDVRMLSSDEIAQAAVQSTAAKSTPLDADNHKPLEGLRILLAEDGLDNQKLIEFILTKAGAEVTIADNGQIGWELATAAKTECRSFDVILMDMQMPVLDGYAATRRLRHDGYNLPIIALTANAMVTDRQKCLDAGCDDYASKPVDRKKLIALVASHARPEAVMTFGCT